MENIKNIITKENPHYEDLISCFEEVKKEGNVVVIKFDGERIENGYTVFISFINQNKEMIRVDGISLKECIIQVLKKYIE